MNNQSSPSSATHKTYEIGLLALFTLIFSSMMGGGVFDIPQNIAHQSLLPAILISWIITIIGMSFLAWAFVYITYKKPEIDSGIYGYAKHGFGDYVGFNSAWGYWLNALLGNTSYLIYIFATLGHFGFFKFFTDGVNTLSLICESLLIWIIYFLIARGIKEAAIINIIISFIKIAALIIIIIVFFYAFNWQQFITNFHHDLNINNHNEFNMGSIFSQIKNTMLVTVWDFLGIEAACIYAIRAKNMQDVAKATVLGLTAVLIIDILISLLPFGITTTNIISGLSTPSVTGVLNIIIGAVTANAVRIMILVSVLGALFAWTMLATNIVYLGAIDKTMPKIFNKVNKNNVPIGSLLMSVIALQIFLLGAYFTNSAYLTMIKLATSLILVPYLLATLFAFKLIITNKTIDYLSLAKGIVAVSYACWLIYAGGVYYLCLGAVLYSIGALIYIVARIQHQATIFSNYYEKFICGIILFTTLILLLYSVLL